MLMDSFEVENFRSLKHLKLEKLARVNLLVGKNNVGKTSVLEAIYALISAGTSNWLTMFLRERGMNSSEFDFGHLFYTLNTERTISLSMRYSAGSQAPLFGNEVNFVRVDMSYISGTTSQDDLDWEAHGSVQRSVQEGGLAVEIRTNFMNEPAKFELISVSERALPHFRLRESTDNQTEINEMGNSGRFKIFARPNISFIPSYSILRNYSGEIEKIKIAKLDNELVEVLRQVDARIERIELGNKGNILFDLGNHLNRLLPAALMGEGIQRLLSIISVLANRKHGTILIDEIDNGLHYSALQALWKGILYAAHKYDVQIVATTHSAEALRHLTRVLDKEENISYRSDVAAYTLIQAEDDTIRSYRHDYEQLDYALDHGLEVRN
jgi:AAA15 family ATPase/GTPase